MKKISLISVSIILTLMVFACSWEVPESLKITGNAGIENFTLDYNISKEISKSIKDSFDFDDENEPYVVHVLDCTEVPEVFAFMIHMDIDQLEFDNSVPAPENEMHTAPMVSSPINLTQMEMSDILDFENIDYDKTPFAAKLYLTFIDKNTGSISDAFNNDDVKVEVKVEGNKLPAYNNNDLVVPNPSGIKEHIDNEIYPETALPGGLHPNIEYGLHFVFEDLAEALFAKKGEAEEVELIVDLHIFNTMLFSDFLDDFDVFIEIVYWLPFDITFKDPLVINENCYEYDNKNYIKFKLPLDNDDDMFNRDNSDDSGFIKHVRELTMELQFNQPFFPDTIVLLETNEASFSKEIRKELAENEEKIKLLSINFEQDDLEKIKNDENCYPFVPEFSLLIKDGGKLKLSKDFVLNKFTLITDIYYEEDF